MRRQHGGRWSAGLLGAAVMLLSVGAALPQGMPADIDPQSGMRLPLPKREDLDEARRRIFDNAARPDTLAGLRGPSGIQLLTRAGPHVNVLNNYLRSEAGISPREREIAILVTAREMDSQIEWVAHEPEALKQGVPQAVIDTIKHRRSTTGLEEADAVLIELGRQLWRDHKLTSEAFARAKASLGPQKLIDVVTLMGSYATAAALLATVDMRLPSGKEPLLPVR